MQIPTAIFIALLIFGLASCSAVQTQIVQVVSKDLSISIARGEKALGPDDALVVCYKALDEVIKAQEAADSIGDGYLLDAVMKARIVDQVRAKVGKQLQQACGQITMEVMMQAVRRGR